MLICDYDGTLAPFREDKMQAFPYEGVQDRLEQIVRQGTKLAFVSGRPIGELVKLLPFAASVEVWGMHGREHRTADGSYRRMEPTPEQRALLDQAQAALDSAGWGALLERKVGSVALHWRTLQKTACGANPFFEHNVSPSREVTWAQSMGSKGNFGIEGEQQSQAAEYSLHAARKSAEEVFAGYAGHHSLGVLPFDGGLELRTEDRTKGHALEALLLSVDASAAAFLGDDTTDEDGFRVMREQGGLGLLVREESRTSHAHFSLKPPGELLAFLDGWIRARIEAGNEMTVPVL